MATYFFDITMNGRVSMDQIGYSLGSAVEAQFEATKIASELLFDQVWQYDQSDHFQIKITDATGVFVGVYTIRYDLNVRH